MNRDLRTFAEDLLIEALGPDAYLLEAWSDAARAASAAARRARAGGPRSYDTVPTGGNWRQAARTAYTKSAAGRSAAYTSFAKAETKANAPSTKGGWAQRAFEGHRASKRAEAKGKRFEPIATSRGVGDGYRAVSKRIALRKEARRRLQHPRLSAA